MILHFIIDNSFINIAHNTFEKVSPNNNEYILISKRKNKIINVKNINVKIISPLRIWDKKFLNGLNKYEFIVLHWLDEYKIQLVKNSPNNLNYLWIGWGGDYYKYLDKELYLKLTSRFIHNTNNNRNIKEFIKSIVFNRNYKSIIETINKIKYFSPVLYEDYCLLSKRINKFYPKYIDWNYGSLENDLVPNKNIIINGDNILIGNSATPENNHLDIFELLKKFDINNRKIICPLSYGNEKYRDYIIKKGYNLFNNNFIPIIKFMPIQEYINILSTCSIVIMGHLRQQALGNIIITMYIGAKIFLYKENPIYEFFKKNNSIIFLNKEIEKYLNTEKLNKNQVMINRSILKKYWSEEVILEKTRHLIKNLMNSKENI